MIRTIWTHTVIGIALSIIPAIYTMEKKIELLPTKTFKVKDISIKNNSIIYVDSNNTSKTLIENPVDSSITLKTIGRKLTYQNTTTENSLVISQETSINAVASDSNGKRIVVSTTKKTSSRSPIQVLDIYQITDNNYEKIATKELSTVSPIDQILLNNQGTQIVFVDGITVKLINILYNDESKKYYVSLPSSYHQNSTINNLGFYQENLIFSLGALIKIINPSDGTSLHLIKNSSILIEKIICIPGKVLGFSRDNKNGSSREVCIWEPKLPQYDFLKWDKNDLFHDLLLKYME